MSDIDWFGEATGINKITAQPVMDAAPLLLGRAGCRSQSIGLAKRRGWTRSNPDGSSRVSRLNTGLGRLGANVYPRQA